VVVVLFTWMNRIILFLAGSGLAASHSVVCIAGDNILV
jgi:hypothetical protein